MISLHYLGHYNKLLTDRMSTNGQMNNRIILQPQCNLTHDLGTILRKAKTTDIAHRINAIPAFRTDNDRYWQRN